MLKTDDITFSYTNKIVLKNISFIGKEGKTTAILGKNGSGKTTLLKIIDKLLKPKSGTVLIDNQDIKKISRFELADYIGYCPQTTFIPQSTVFETILLGRTSSKKFFVSEKDFEIVNHIITLMDLTELAFSQIDQISGGELQKVIIARAIVSHPKILLLDEPINHLDIKNQHEIMRLLCNITKEMNISTVIVLHDINIALRYVDNLIVLKNGNTIFSGKKDTITKNIIEEAYELKIKIIYDERVPIAFPLL